MIWPKIVALARIDVPQLCALGKLRQCASFGLDRARCLAASLFRRSRFWPIVFPAAPSPARRKSVPCSLSVLMRKTARACASYGSIGYIGFDGRMDTSIIIRTVEISGAHLSFHVGGGIVADSAAGG